jgi:hypothetical protein
MDTVTILCPSRWDKVFRLHSPTYQTQQPSYISCGAPIAGLSNTDSKRIKLPDDRQTLPTFKEAQDQ